MDAPNLKVKQIRCHIGVQLGVGTVDTGVSISRHDVDMFLHPAGVMIVGKKKQFHSIVPFSNITEIQLDKVEDAPKEIPSEEE